MTQYVNDAVNICNGRFKTDNPRHVYNAIQTIEREIAYYEKSEQEIVDSGEKVERYRALFARLEVLRAARDRGIDLVSELEHEETRAEHQMRALEAGRKARAGGIA